MNSNLYSELLNNDSGVKTMSKFEFQIKLRTPILFRCELTILCVVKQLDFLRKSLWVKCARVRTRTHTPLTLVNMQHQISCRWYYIFQCLLRNALSKLILTSEETSFQQPNSSNIFLLPK